MSGNILFHEEYYPLTNSNRERFVKEVFTLKPNKFFCTDFVNVSNAYCILQFVTGIFCKSEQAEDNKTDRQSELCNLANALYLLSSVQLNSSE